MKKFFYFLFTIFLWNACQPQNQKDMSEQKKYKYTNLLIHENSPYLLQHAHNPVNWHPWGKEALSEAKKNNKLLIISIGYAACHWCHVMEHESFEDSLVAKLMNKFYIPVKVDREEHPDVDKIYMSAVQQLTGRGGWPLNVVALPDGRPVWGGTYFPRNKWMSALEQIAEIWHKNPDKLYKIADQLEEGIKASEIVQVNENQMNFNLTPIKESLDFWRKYKDETFGGFKRAPKFPMPAQYNFLLRASVQTDNHEILEFVKLTLNRMLQGGIYDHVNGGFARYSTDMKWHIPHFEKMLYDNAQLVSLYSDAYLVFKDASYKKTVEETLNFIENELTDSSGAFYSSLDADSENEKGILEEGAYYVFTKDELKKAIGEDYPLFKKYYNINDFGLWENGKYHLIKKMSDSDFVQKYNISSSQLEKKLKYWRKQLQKLRKSKKRPRLDDKSLTSWNALMLNAYINAYKTFGKKHYLDVALKNANFLAQHQIRENGGLWHSYKNGDSKIEGVLEDYAHLIRAYINLYEATGDEQWLRHSEELLQYSLKHFYESKSGMFYFTDENQNNLLTRPMEIEDHVIPSSNAVMADNLFKLGHFFEKKEYIEKSKRMIHNILPKTHSYPPGYYEWNNTLLNYLGKFYEIAITGETANEKAMELFQYYIPNKIVAQSNQDSNLPLLKNRWVKNKTLIYLCVDNTCQLPQENIGKIVEQVDIKIE